MLDVNSPNIPQSRIDEYKKYAELRWYTLLEIKEEWLNAHLMVEWEEDGKVVQYLLYFYEHSLDAPRGKYNWEEFVITQSVIPEIGYWSQTDFERRIRVSSLDWEDLGWGIPINRSDEENEEIEIKTLNFWNEEVFVNRNSSNWPEIYTKNWENLGWFILWKDWETLMNYTLWWKYVYLLDVDEDGIAKFSYERWWNAFYCKYNQQDISLDYFKLWDSDIISYMKPSEEIIYGQTLDWRKLGSLLTDDDWSVRMVEVWDKQIPLVKQFQYEENAFVSALIWEPGEEVEFLFDSKKQSLVAWTISGEPILIWKTKRLSTPHAAYSWEIYSQDFQLKWRLCLDQDFNIQKVKLWSEQCYASSYSRGWSWVELISQDSIDMEIDWKRQTLGWFLLNEDWKTATRFMIWSEWVKVEFYRRDKKSLDLRSLAWESLPSCRITDDWMSLLAPKLWNHFLFTSELGNIKDFMLTKRNHEDLGRLLLSEDKTEVQTIKHKWYLFVYDLNNDEEMEDRLKCFTPALSKVNHQQLFNKVILDSIVEKFKGIEIQRSTIRVQTKKIIGIE